MTIAELLRDAASDLDGVEARNAGAGFEWAVTGIVFAAAAGDSAEFRLDPVVARAALGTPDTRASARGVDWVAFSPPALDRLAEDRAVAWFGSAYRRAAAPPERQESRRPRR